MEQITIWILDDHKLRREGLFALFQEWAKENSYKIYEAESCDHIFPPQLSGDGGEDSQLCLLGIGGLSLSTKDVQQRIKAIQAVLGERPLVLFRDDVTRSEIEICRELGVKGLICTYVDRKIATRALEHVLAGNSYFSPAQTPIDAAQSSVASGPSSHYEDDIQTFVYETEMNKQAGFPAWSALSDRQVDVLRGLSQGQSNKLIARALNLSEATVKVHVRALIQKFGVDNRTQVALMARDPAILNGDAHDIGNRPTAAKSNSMNVLIDDGERSAAS